MWTAAEAWPAAIAAAIGAAWLTGIANAWAAPELIWNREDAKSPVPGARDLWALPGGQRIG
jgi:hypothetical protein